ncbi:phosphate ABC transporter substrate-binding protein [candidate division KSB1 bacterium]|nr:phosphate ABC transporter substrate-binding protein [candidate division KSB1 bacterium]
MRYMLILLIFIICCQPLYRRETKIIRLKGSDTMLILASKWAEKYMKLHPSISIYVEGGGTESGIKALINGEIDICLASRPMRPAEVKLLAEKYGKIGLSFLVAKDALSVYIHPANPVKNLTPMQLKKIFRGEIHNWRELGGEDRPVLIFIRPPNSGTYLYFQEHVLDGEAYSSNVQTFLTTEALSEAIAKNSNSIGFGGVAYGPGIEHCKINGIDASIENLQNDTYPIIRYLYLYTVDTPAGPIKALIDWILRDGQRVVKEVGYVSLWGNN